mmetsp:Transcript_4804/g.9500  ORF Transcript_4804/g.9500 Transcript_4804/m.9500 type:complete len:105 (+) Transcript_4804:690-1004(+)
MACVWKIDIPLLETRTVLSRPFSKAVTELSWLRRLTDESWMRLTAGSESQSCPTLVSLNPHACTAECAVMSRTADSRTAELAAYLVNGAPLVHAEPRWELVQVA